jgi:hypothetical protein
VRPRPVLLRSVEQSEHFVFLERDQPHRNITSTAHYGK